MRGRAQSDDYRVDGREEQQSGGLGVLEIRVDVPARYFATVFGFISILSNLLTISQI